MPRTATATLAGRIGKTDRHTGVKRSCWADLDEATVWDQAAKAEGMTFSAWLRRAANRAAELEAKQEKLREVLT